MGLLDDAIREHLDLKRRSGADPTEIERMEREALGPVRREPVPSALTDAPVEEHELELLDDGESVEQEHHEHDELALEADAVHTGPEPQETFEPPHVEAVQAVEPEQPKRRRGFLGRHRSEPPEEKPIAPELGASQPGAGYGQPGPAPEPDLYEDEHDEFDDDPFAEDDFDAPQTHREPSQPSPPPLEFEQKPPRRPHFGELPSNRDRSPSPSREEPEPVADPDATVEHRLPEAERFPLDDIAESTEPPQGDPLEDEFDEFGEHTMEHDVEQAFADEDARHSEPEPEPDPALRERRRPAEPAPTEPEGEAAAEEDEDLLEETPDFLQDTPDHDRLWFEQKPPRDFDFDG